MASEKRGLEIGAHLKCVFRGMALASRFREGARRLSNTVDQIPSENMYGADRT